MNAFEFYLAQVSSLPPIRWATKYIAAADEESLYPERRVGNIHWTNLDSDWFLLPNPWKVGFTTGIIGLTKKGQPRRPDDWGALRA